MTSPTALVRVGGADEADPIRGRRSWGILARFTAALRQRKPVVSRKRIEHYKPAANIPVTS